MTTVSGGTTSERFGFIQRYREIGITFLCDWLKVSRSGFYSWEKRKASKRYYEDQRILKHITKIFWRSAGCYGSPRVFRALLKQGISVGRKRVERLMRVAGLKARVSIVTGLKPGLKKFNAHRENMLLESSAPTNINQVWVADVTYLKVKGSWDPWTVSRLCLLCMASPLLHKIHNHKSAVAGGVKYQGRNL